MELAAKLLQKAKKETSFKERLRENMVARMLQDPKGRAFATALTDRCFRISNESVAKDQIAYLIKKFGLPKFLPLPKRLLFYLFKSNPRLILEEIRKEMAPVLLLEEEKEPFLKEAKKRGERINLNIIGEAILGEEEAIERKALYLEAIQNPLIPCVSVKISTLYSQISLLAWDETLSVLKERLRVLYREAQFHHKLITLDMEEAKDFDLTVALFKALLCEEEFLNYRGGIVLQSYLPNSFVTQQELTHFAIERVKHGGAPLRLRIVKGANLQAELCESALKNWPVATFESKIETDANFKRMVDYALNKERAEALHIGIGSHNLFDIAWALNLREERGVSKFVEFEMLKGMADPLSRVIKKESGSLLLYCPLAKKEEFEFAIGYLLRRLDENSGKENFLHDYFSLKEKSASWEHQKRLFEESFSKIENLSYARKRASHLFRDPTIFTNEPDTDLSVVEGRDFAHNVLKRTRIVPLETIPKLSLSQAEVALKNAKNSHENLDELLNNVANLFRKHRGDLIEAMIIESHKIFEEADTEVSEAIDFIDYYRVSRKHLPPFSPKGKVLIAPPWNFPVSIPVSGIVAALITKNSVLFKPAPETPFIGLKIAELFWQAGFSKEALQFIPCEDEVVGSFLVKECDMVALTGATDTAKKFLKMRPGLDLIAETGGKNTLIVSALCDRDLAIKDILHSAFSHAGQKCSALSLLILYKDHYDDPKFLATLKDAARSLFVGEAFDPRTKVPPLIRAPEGALKRALSTLDEGESWLLKPEQDRNNPHLFSPGIKIGVKKGSFTHQTELFGPILGVMRAENLSDAIELANSTPYGLTAGLHSLDEREHVFWEKRIIAGNLYINRTITGAIVQRQPFGGTKASGFGKGAKAGGPHYVLQFAKLEEKELPHDEAPLPQTLLPLLSQLRFEGEERDLFQRSLKSYAHANRFLKAKHDPSHILGQDNFFYMVPCEKMLLRIEEGDRPVDYFRVIAACLIAETPLEISAPFKIRGLKTVVEAEEAFLKLVGSYKRIRILREPSQALKERTAKEFVYLAKEPVYASGRLELLNYLREVSLSYTYHRYGYINK